jgi:tellurite resistance protein
MKVTVTNITGFASMFEAMYMSKRSWTPELAQEIRDVCYVIEQRGRITVTAEQKKKFERWLDMALKMSRKHITVGKFLDITIMTEGLHRAGQDDVDAHAERFDNRIIRNSTRLATFEQDEFSDYYKNKVMTTDTMIKTLGVNIPLVVYELDDGEFCVFEPADAVIKNTWRKVPNGYVKEQYIDDKDVLRGLYMLGIPSNFISKINLSQFGHVFKERNKNGGANPEVKEWAESVMQEITRMYPMITRDYVLSIEN